MSAVVGPAAGSGVSEQELQAPFVELSAARDAAAPGGSRGSLLPGVRVLVLDETVGGRRCHRQPAADAAVRAAAAQGFCRVVTGSSGNYGWAVARAAREAGMAATVVMPVGFVVDAGRTAAAGATVLRAGATYKDAVAASREYVDPLCADVNVDGPYSRQVLAAHRAVVDRIAMLPGEAPAAVWVPLGNGTTAAAVGGGVLARGWSTAVVGVSSAGNNSVVASWSVGRHRPIEASAVRASLANEPLATAAALYGEAAIGVLRATGGVAMGVEDAALFAAQDLLRRCGLGVSPAGAAGLAGLLEEAGRRRVRRGRHVAVLTA